MQEEALNELEMVDGDEANVETDGETEDSFVNNNDVTSNYSETDDVYKINDVLDETTKTE